MYDVRTFPGWDGIRIFVTVENAWGDYRGNLDYDVSVYGGEASPQLLFSENAVTQLYCSRWGREFWIGNEPSATNIRYDLSYLASTGLIPNYDTSRIVPESEIQSEYSNWQSTDNSLMGNAMIAKYFPTTGGRQEIGLLPSWCVRWLLTMDHRMAEVAISNGLQSAAAPIHFRESNSAKSAFGEIITIDDRPTIWFNKLDFSYTTDDDKLPPPIGVEDSNWTIDRAHQGSFVYLPYLLTGERYFLDELYFWSGYNLGASNFNASWGRDSEKGLFRDQVRGEAWAFRSLCQTAAIAPDAHWQKTYFEDKVSNNIAQWEIEYLNGAYHPLGGWGTVSGRSADGGRPYDNVIDEVRSLYSSWMDDYMLMALGSARELGYPTDALADYLGQFTTDRFTHPDFNPYLGDSYRMPATYTDDPTALNPELDYTSWADVLAAYIPSLQTTQQHQSTDYSETARAALSFVTHLPKAQDAITFIEGNIDPTVAAPRFAIVPSAQPSSDTDSDGLPDAWEQQWFGSATAADPFVDEEMDGLTNLAEFALGRDSLTSEPQDYMTLAPTVGTDTLTRMHVEFILNDDAQGLNHEVELSLGNIQSWSSGGSSTELVSQTDNSNGTQTVIWRSLHPIENEPVQFFRLKFSTP